MKPHLLIPFTAAVASLALVSVVSAATPTHSPARGKGYVGQELAGQARITIDAARAAALKAHPGQVTDQELEKEGGGSGLRYSFDIKSSGKTYEVGVDARTGKVLENAKEGPHPD